MLAKTLIAWLLLGVINMSLAWAEGLSAEEAGRTTFLQYCAPCHGKDASGGSTPDIRGLPKEDIAMAIQGVDQMPEIPVPKELFGGLADYLGSLIADS